MMKLFVLENLYTVNLDKQIDNLVQARFSLKTRQKGESSGWKRVVVVFGDLSVNSV